jgi:hypothetical protein
MTKQNAVVAIYKSHGEAGAAMNQLQESGFDMKQLSIVGRDTPSDENVLGYYNTGPRMKYSGKTGAFWGGIWGFYSLGIPNDSVLRYVTAVQTGRYVLVAHGVPEETGQARCIIRETNPEAMEYHQPAAEKMDLSLLEA